MADWYQQGTQLQDAKGRLLTHPYQFSLEQHVFDQDRYEEVFVNAERWCQEQFGFHGGGFRVGSFVIGFERECDATAFKIRWC